jgi:hypothetical protein
VVGLAANQRVVCGRPNGLPIRAAAEWPRGLAAVARPAASLLDRSEVGVSRRSIGVLQLDARRIGEVGRPHHTPGRAHRGARRDQSRYRRQRRQYRSLVRPWSRDRLRRRQMCPNGHVAWERFPPLTPPFLFMPRWSCRAPRSRRQVREDAGHSRHEDSRSACHRREQRPCQSASPFREPL